VSRFKYFLNNQAFKAVFIYFDPVV